VPHDIGVIETGHADGVDFGHGKLNIGQAMEAIKGSDFCLLVTEPTPFGLNDLVLAVETMRQYVSPVIYSNKIHLKAWGLNYKLKVNKINLEVFNEIRSTGKRRRCIGTFWPL